MQARDVRQVGVVGCGLMGSGIVEVCARAGLEVTFAEGSPELVEAGWTRIDASLGRAMERGKLDRDEGERVRARIAGVEDLAGLAQADLVIEAATEDPTAKAGIFARLGELARPEVVLASNTSSIPISSLGHARGRPDRVVGMHFFNPVPVMPLIELTPSAATADATYELVRELGADVLGKTCVRSSDEAGFIVNRLLIPYLYDAMRLVERDFATREDIDTAIRLGLGHPMGPLALADLIGQDTVRNIGEVLRSAFDEPRYEAPAILDRLIAEGKLGRKTGAGFFEHAGA
jgi:3-hydroxybutyryl-CoA dehydrogenase